MRVVMHVDMDAFFASVAQLDRPELGGLPLLVGGRGPRGVVAAASYEARAFGIRSGMAMAQARRLCPQAVVVGASGARYRELHAQLRLIWARFAPVVQVVGIDEAYLDLTGCGALWGPPKAIAFAIQKAVRQETGLPCTLGVGSNKLIAKMASRAGKPCGVLQVPAGHERTWLAPQAVGALPGVGPAAQARLKAMGFVRLGQLAQANPDDLLRLFGDWGPRLGALARGEDMRPVREASEPAQSLGAERTFPHDLRDASELAAAFHRLAHQVAPALRQQGLLAKRVAVKLRFPDFTTCSRSQSLLVGLDDEGQLAKVAIALWTRHVGEGQALRLIGIQCSHLVAHEELNWLNEGMRVHQRHLNQRLDALRVRFGPQAIQWGGALAIRPK